MTTTNQEVPLEIMGWAAAHGDLSTYPAVKVFGDAAALVSDTEDGRRLLQVFRNGQWSEPVEVKQTP